MSKLKFSIVTISFNQARFIEQAIRSVIEQKYPYIEYIIVDPGSTDGSRDIINNYSGKIDKIIYEPDNGPADGLNKGFAHATGDVYGYINADDYYEPDAFSSVAKLFGEKPYIDVINGAIKIVDSNGHMKLRKRMSDEFDLEDFAEGMCWIAQQATFFKKACFRNTPPFNVANNTCWDAEHLVDIALNGHVFHRINKLLANFRIYNESISGSGRLNEVYLNDMYRIRNKIYNNIPKSRSAYVNSLKKFMYKIDIRRQLINYTVK